jgi:AcrR family transcriptional regulator
MAANVRPKPRKKVLGPRVPPQARQRQLIAVAAELLTDHGEDRVQITDVAERAGVSRPLVYRLFPTRQALVRAVLEDFAQFLTQRFQQARGKHGPQDVHELVSAYVEACCKAISAKGAGPWLLLDPRGADPQMAQIGREIFLELLNPWQDQLGAFLGVSNRRASHVLWIVVTAGRAALGGWIEGTVSRKQAIKDATAVVIALLRVLASE